MTTNAASYNQLDTPPSSSISSENSMPVSQPGIGLQSGKKAVSPLKRSRDAIEPAHEEKEGDVITTSTETVTADVMAVAKTTEFSSSTAVEKRKAKKSKTNVEEVKNDHKTQIENDTTSGKDGNTEAEKNVDTDSNEKEDVVKKQANNDTRAPTTQTAVAPNPSQSPPPIKTLIRTAPPKATEQKTRVQQASASKPVPLPSIANFHLRIPTATSTMAMVSTNGSTDLINDDMPIASKSGNTPIRNCFKPAMKRTVRRTNDDNGPDCTTKSSPPVRFLECKIDQTQNDNSYKCGAAIAAVTKGYVDNDVNTGSNSESDVEKTLLANSSTKKEAIDSPSSITTPTATRTTSNNAQDAEGRVNGLYHYYFKRPIDRLTPIPVKFNKTTPTDTDAEGEFVRPEPIRPTMHVPR